MAGWVAGRVRVGWLVGCGCDGWWAVGGVADEMVGGTRDFMASGRHAVPYTASGVSVEARKEINSAQMADMGADLGFWRADAGRTRGSFVFLVYE